MRFTGRAAVVVAAALCAGIASPVGEANSPGKSQPGSSMKPAIAYKPLGFAEVPGWEEDDHAAAFKAFLQVVRARRCHRARARRARQGAASVRGPRLLLARRQASSQGPSARPTRKAFFERHFTPNAVVHNGPRGLLTGYYEPLLQGSRTPQGAFQTPVYKRPPDLVNLVDETQRATAGMALTHARKTDKGTEPYPTRAQIEQGALKGRDSSSLYLPTRSRCSSCRSRARGASS